MQYSAPTYQPRLSVLSRCLIAACCSMIGACGGGGGASSEPEKPLSAELPSMTTAAATAASGADSAASAASVPEATAQVAAGIEVPDANATAASAAASDATASTSKSAATAAKVNGADAVTASSTNKKAPAAQAIKTDTAVAPTPAPSPAPNPAPAMAVATTTKITPTPTPTLVLPTLIVPAPAVAPQTTAQTSVTAKAGPIAQVSIWNQPESLATAAIANGNGLTSTASSAVAYQAPSLGIFFGFRDAREDWPGLKDRYNRVADIASWVKTEKARVDSWMARNFERADLVGGWTQGYIDPKTGQALTWTPASPEPANGSTEAEKAFKGAWVALGRDYNIVQIQTAARLYKLTGETKYAVWAAQQLDFYGVNYGAWPVRTSEGRSTMYMQGLDEAVASFALIDSARLLETYASSTRYLTWRDKLFMPMATNLKSTSAPMSNIALWHNAAIAAIAMRYKDTALLDYAQNGSQGIKAVIAYALTADNFWIEGTFAYNNYVLDGMSKLLTQAGVEGYGSRFTAEREQALKLLLAAFDYHFDNNSLPNPNDSRGAQTLIAQPAHWWLFRFAPTYWGLDKANKWRTWESLLDVPATIPATEPAIPAAMTRNFPTLNQAVLRAGNWQAYVHYGQSNGNHVQEELTTFELHEGKTPLAYDAGTVDYSLPHHKNYFQRGAANNVPLINGVGQDIWAKGTVKLFSAGESRLVVEQAKYQNDVSVTRGYRVTTSGFAEQTNITVKSGLNKRLGVVFNTTCAVAFGNGTSAAASVAALPNVNSMGYWTKTEMRNGQSNWQATLTCGATRYQMNITGPANQRIYLSKAPNTPTPSERNALYYEVDGTTANFETEIRRIN